MIPKLLSFPFYVILAAVCILLLASSSCSDTKKIKLGLMLPNFTNVRYQRDRDYFLAKAKEKDVEVIVCDAQNDDIMQLEQAEDLIKNGVDIIVITCVNKNTAARIVRHAHAHDIKVIAYERIIKNSDLDYFYAFDNVQVGELMASYAVSKRPEGNYLLLEGDKSDQNALWVAEGQMNVLASYIKSGKIKVGYKTFVESWQSDNACHETKQYIQLSGEIPDVVLAGSDGIASGVILALDEEKVTIGAYPIITGQNANPDACRSIVKGKQSMTVYKPIKKFAENAFELALKCAKGENVTTTEKTFNGLIDVPTFLSKSVLVDVTNLKSTVILDGFLKESDIFGN